MKAKSKSKTKAPAAATGSPDKPDRKKYDRSELVRLGRHMMARFTERREERGNPGDQENRRRMIAAFGRLPAKYFPQVDREGLHYVTTDDLSDGACAVLGDAMAKLGDAREAELCAAILHRFEGVDGDLTQLADDFIRMVKQWAYGTDPQQVEQAPTVAAAEAAA